MFLSEKQVHTCFWEYQKLERVCQIGFGFNWIWMNGKCLQRAFVFFYNSMTYDAGWTVMKELPNFD